MESSASELHLERLLGTRVRDPEGRVAGRIEEFLAEQIAGEWVITEFHVGAAARLERFLVAVGGLPLFSALPLGAHPIRRVRWDQIALGDPEHPRLLVPRDELEVATR